MKPISRKLAISLGVAAAVAAGTIIAALSVRGEGPPLAGWMQRFEPAETPRPARGSAFFDERGGTYTVDDFRGKVVLVNFWATWCGPCIREMPSLLRLQQALKDEDFVLIALSEDRRGWPLIKPFLARLGLSELTVFHDATGLTMRSFGVKGLPTSILFDRDGNEVGQLRGHAEWDTPEAKALIRYYLGS